MSIISIIILSIFFSLLLIGILSFIISFNKYCQYIINRKEKDDKMQIVKSDGKLELEEIWKNGDNIYKVEGDEKDIIDELIMTCFNICKNAANDHFKDYIYLAFPQDRSIHDIDYNHLPLDKTKDGKIIANYTNKKRIEEANKRMDFCEFEYIETKNHNLTIMLKLTLDIEEE